MRRRRAGRRPAFSRVATPELAALLWIRLRSAESPAGSARKRKEEGILKLRDCNSFAHQKREANRINQRNRAGERRYSYSISISTANSDNEPAEFSHQIDC